jgi:predicted transcriptional regulator
MTNTFKEARVKAGLSVAQCAELLATHPVTIRRYEVDPDKPTHRKPPELALKVLDWYTAGNAPSL